MCPRQCAHCLGLPTRPCAQGNVPKADQAMCARLGARVRSALNYSRHIMNLKRRIRNLKQEAEIKTLERAKVDCCRRCKCACNNRWLLQATQVSRSSKATQVSQSSTLYFTTTHRQHHTRTDIKYFSILLSNCHACVCVYVRACVCVFVCVCARTCVCVCVCAPHMRGECAWHEAWSEKMHARVLIPYGIRTISTICMSAKVAEWRQKPLYKPTSKTSRAKHSMLYTRWDVIRKGRWASVRQLTKTMTKTYHDTIRHIHSISHTLHISYTWYQHTFAALAALG